MATMMLIPAIIIKKPSSVVQIMDVHEGGIHAEGLQGSVQQVVGAAVNGILGNDMVARPGYSLDRRETYRGRRSVA